MKIVGLGVVGVCGTLALSLPTPAGPSGPSFVYAGLLPSLISFRPPSTPIAKEARYRHRRPARHAPRVVHAPRATVSLYERTTRRRLLRAQGCSAARRGVAGIVILDFGKPAHHHGTYGTILFSNRFAGNRRITRAMLAYAVAYARCLPRGSRSHIALARGTSNYHLSVPSAFEAGRRWARETDLLGRMLAIRGLEHRVRSAAADDAEPAWDPGFRTTRDFFRGYRSAGFERTLYDFGSLDGGVGHIWNARQAFYVAGGMRYSRAVPEIYTTRMAREWAELARLAQRRFHRPVRFAGVMTQHLPGCDCSFRPPEARATLVRELARRVGPGAPAVPPSATNIRAPR